MNKLLWQVRCTYHYVTILETYNIKFCWGMAKSSLENINYDTTEDPRGCVLEELSYWVD
jgi:hypothetical protein